jgi:hypothetical protein
MQKRGDELLAVLGLASWRRHDDLHGTRTDRARLRTQGPNGLRGCGELHVRDASALLDLAPEVETDAFGVRGRRPDLLGRGTGTL